MKPYFLLVTLFSFTSCGKVAPWERANLARKAMAPDRNPLGEAMADHMYFSREGSLGGKGVGGGGCGCN
jgi:hypothetical protein